MSADNDPMRALTRALFADPEAPQVINGGEPTPEPTERGNHVPREGNHPHVTHPDAEMREFVRGLFDRAE